MQVAYVCQRDPTNDKGGGAVYENELINTIKATGHDISIFTPNYYIDRIRADLVIGCDLFNQPSLRHNDNAWFQQNSLDEVLSNNRYVLLECGYSSVCDQDYLACGLVYRGCSQCFCVGERQRWLQKFYGGAKAAVLLSPLHQTTIEKAIDCQLTNVLFMRPPVDTKLFYNKQQKRDWSYIYVGVINTAKGCHNIINRYADKDIHWFGTQLWPHKLPGTYHGHIPREQLNDYLNRAENFIGLPSWPEPYGLVYSEAAIAGCNLIWNDNVGAKSWNRDLTDSNFYQDTGKAIWQELLQKISN